MSIELVDAQCGFGGATPGDPSIVGADQLVADLKRIGLTRALPRLLPEEIEIDAPAANARLHAACAEHPGLSPCPLVVPSGGGDLPSEEEQVSALLAQGAAAACIRPDRDYWTLAPWNCDALFHALERRRLPVMVSLAKLGIEAIGGLAERYPDLPFLLLEASYRQYRSLVPLLAAFPGTYLVLGGGYAVHGGLEYLAATVGAERVVFGTGFPVTEPMTAVTYLMYSGLSDEQKQLVGAGNLDRLMGGIQR